LVVDALWQRLFMQMPFCTDRYILRCSDASTAICTAE
jgi:hypothetical protein